MSNFKFQGALVLPGPLPTPINMGVYLWGLEKVQRFVNIHLHCIVSNLKSNKSMLPPLEKFLRTPVWCRSRGESAPLKVLICQKFGKISKNVGKKF